MSRSMVITGGTSGTSLQLHTPGDYFLLEGAFSLGQQQHRRKFTESEAVVARYATSIVEAQRIGTVGVAVCSDVEEALQPKLMAVLAIVKEFRFTLTWQYGPLSGSWMCETADDALGSPSGVLDEFWLAEPGPFVQVLYLTVPHRRLTGP